MKEWGFAAGLLTRLACWAVRRLVKGYGAEAAPFQGGHLVIRNHRGHVMGNSFKVPRHRDRTGI